MSVIIAPDYYKEFHCLAGECRHSCCEGWEIDIDEETLNKYEKMPGIAEHISREGVPHFILKGSRCPFLKEDNLCELICSYGEDILCQICRDHPRFRNFWTGRVEIGLGLACEEAARIILGRKEPMKLVVLESDGEAVPLPEDEQWLMDLRQSMLDSVEGDGPDARLLEYLIYRHIADALYDDRLEERIAFIQESYGAVLDEWDKTDGSLEALAECARKFSAEKEYVE